MRISLCTPAHSPVGRLGASSKITHTARCAQKWPGAPPVCFELLPRGVSMNLNLSITPFVSLIAGALILIDIVAIYLIVIGLIGLFGSGTFHLR
jgi:hypothetical protein